MISESPQFHFDNLHDMETRIRVEFSGRILNFFIEQMYDGLLLHGQTNTYHRKQQVQHAVMEATEIPIRANNIVVGCREDSDAKIAHTER